MSAVLYKYNLLTHGLSLKYPSITRLKVFEMPTIASRNPAAWRSFLGALESPAALSYKKKKDYVRILDTFHRRELGLNPVAAETVGDIWGH